MGRSRYRFVEPSEPHFMTCTVSHWIPVFTRPETVEILLDSFRFIAGKGVTVYAYIVLENHIHVIAQSDDIGRDIGRFKSHTAKQLLAYLKEQRIKMILDQLAFYKKAHKQDRQHQFWQEGVHPERIQSDDMMRQKIEYIHDNPVKRGYVDDPLHWRYSSARNYAGLGGLIDVYTEWG